MKNIPKINKFAQEEMVGFALIVIIVAVILLILLAFWLKSPKGQGVESYEVESFLQSSLQYTTDCRDSFRFLSVQNLIFECNDRQICSDGRESCEVLESVLREIIKESWKTGENSPLKGYSLNITSNDEEILSIIQGNLTNNYKGSMQPIPRAGDDFGITFSVYY